MIRLNTRVLYRHLLLAVALALFVPAEAGAQGRDPVLNGLVIGAAAGAAAGVFFTHAVRDSDLTAGQYSRGALVFGAIGAAAGAGIDVLLARKRAVSGGSRRA